MVKIMLTYSLIFILIYFIIGFNLCILYLHNIYHIITVTFIVSFIYIIQRTVILALFCILIGSFCIGFFSFCFLLFTVLKIIQQNTKIKSFNLFDNLYIKHSYSLVDKYLKSGFLNFS